MAAPNTADEPRLVDQIHHKRFNISIYEFRKNRFWVLSDLKDQHRFRPQRFTTNEELKKSVTVLIEERERSLKVVGELLAGLAIRQYSFQGPQKTPVNGHTQVPPVAPRATPEVGRTADQPSKESRARSEKSQQVVLDLLAGLASKEIPRANIEPPKKAPEPKVDQVPKAKEQKEREAKPLRENRRESWPLVVPVGRLEDKLITARVITSRPTRQEAVLFARENNCIAWHESYKSEVESGRVLAVEVGKNPAIDAASMKLPIDNEFLGRKAWWAVVVPFKLFSDLGTLTKVKSCLPTREEAEIYAHLHGGIVWHESLPRQYEPEEYLNADLGENPAIDAERPRLAADLLKLEELLNNPVTDWHVVVRAISQTEARVCASFKNIDDAILAVDRDRGLALYPQPFTVKPAVGLIVPVKQGQSPGIDKQLRTLEWLEQQGKFFTFAVWYDRDGLPGIRDRVNFTTGVDFRGEVEDRKAFPLRPIDPGESRDPMYLLIEKDKRIPGLGRVVGMTRVKADVIAMVKDHDLLREAREQIQTEWNKIDFSPRLREIAQQPPGEQPGGASLSKPIPAVEVKTSVIGHEIPANKNGQEFELKHHVIGSWRGSGEPKPGALVTFSTKERHDPGTCKISPASGGATPEPKGPAQYVLAEIIVNGDSVGLGVGRVVGSKPDLEYVKKKGLEHDAREITKREKLARKEDRSARRMEEMKIRPNRRPHQGLSQGL